MRTRNEKPGHGSALGAGCWFTIPAGLRVLGLLTLLVAAPGASADPDTRSVNESRAVSAEGRVQVETVSGTLEVSGWTEPRVEVTGTLDRRLTLALEGADDLVTVRVKWPEKPRRHIRDAVCDLKVRVPATGSLAIEVVSAGVKVSGISGALDVESVSGGVSISGGSRRVEAQVVSGDLDITGASGRISAEAVSGNVSIESSGGEVEATAVSGRVTVRGGPFERVDLEAVSGDTEFDGELAPDAEVDVSNHSGTVDFVLRGPSAGDFDVSTFSGDIRSEFGGDPHRSSKYAPGEEYHFTLGRGGPHIAIESFSGSVRLRRP